MADDAEDLNATLHAIINSAGAGPPTLPRLTAASPPRKGAGDAARASAARTSKFLVLNAQAMLQPMRGALRKPVRWPLRGQMMDGRWCWGAWD